MVARLSSGTKKKISLAQKGKKNSFYGRRHSKHSILMIARAKKGRNNPMYGKRHSTSTRNKISFALRKRWAKKR